MEYNVGDKIIMQNKEYIITSIAYDEYKTKMYGLTNSMKEYYESDFDNNKEERL